MNSPLQAADSTGHFVPRNREGFSVIELLTVLSIVGVMVVAMVPAVSGILGARGVTRGASEFAGFVEQGRAYAMANGTPVWIGLADNIAAGGSEARIYLFAMASRDRSVNFSNSNLVQIGKVNVVERVMLHDSTDRPVESLPGGTSKVRPSADPFLDLPTFRDTSAFPAGITNRIGNALNSARVMRIDPQGAVTFYTAGGWLPARWMEVGISKANSTQPDLKAGSAAVQIASLTGQARIFRLLGTP